MSSGGDGTKNTEVEEENPYDSCCFNKLFFLYMNMAMDLANEREKQDSSLKGITCSILP